MPWKNDGGGGWQGGGGNRGGPWGQGPQGPSGGGGGGRGPSGIPPDLDEIIKRSQDALKKAVPGGGGKLTWILPVLLLIVFVVYKSVNQVQADERGVVLRFGEYTRTVGPGLRYAMWPIESMERLKVESENQTTFGMTDNTGLMLAGDQNLVDIRFSVLWKIDNPEEFLFNVERPERMVSAVAESAMREVVGRTDAEIVRTTGRQAAQDEVMKITQATLSTYKAGILVTAVKLEKADPPEQVVDAFEEVQRAEQNQANLINQADQYANQKNQSAKGETARIVEDAKAYKARVTAEAEGESKRFLSVLEQYSKAKGVTRERLFLEMMEGVLAQSNKVLIEGGQNSPGVVPYLPLPEIKNRQPEAGAVQP